MRKIQQWFAHKPNHRVLYMILGGLLFRGIVAFFLFPGFDEAYYYMYTQNLDWSYFDHPVMVALTTGLGEWATGEIAPFTLRLGALWVHTGSLILIYLTASRLFSAEAARLTLTIATIAPLFAIGFGSLTSPDNMLIFGWTATLYTAACEFFPEEMAASTANSAARNAPLARYRPSYRLAILGLLIGLTCLSKYHGFILGASLVGFCLTSDRHRCALTSPWTGLALSLFILTLFPLWYWNLNHDWISFRFHLSMRFEDGNSGGFNPFEALGAFLAGAAYLFPTIGFPLWWVSGRTLLEQLRAVLAQPRLVDQSDFRQKQGLILWVALPIMAGFTLLGGFQPIYPAWPAPGFWTMTLLLGQRAAIWRRLNRRRVQRWLVGSGLVAATLLLTALLHVATGTFQKPSDYALFGGFIPPQQDGSTSLIDVLQLRRRFADSATVNATLQEVEFIFSNEVFLSSYLDMAIRPLTPLPVICLSQDPRGFALWFEPQQFLGQDALYIALERFDLAPEMTDGYGDYFESLEEIETIALERGGAVTQTFHIYRAQTLLKPYVYPYP